LAAAEDQRAKTGKTELLLLRAHRFFARANTDSAPTITPSQLKRAREQELTTEWQISLASSDGLPIPEAGFVITFANGTTTSGRLDRNGSAKVSGPKGPYTIQYVNHGELRAKALAARIHAAVKGSDTALLLGALSQPANELALARDAYSTYFGGDMATDARGALTGDHGAAGDHLLAAANLSPDAPTAVYAYTDPSQQRQRHERSDEETVLA
jgi:hypothetical protein